MEQNTNAQPTTAQTSTAPAQPAVTPAQPASTAPTNQAQPAAQTSGNYASFLQRLGAALIDIIILVIVQTIIQLPFNMMGGSTSAGTTSLEATTMGPGQAIAQLVGLAYFIYFTYKSGQTPGKKILHIKVVREDATQLTLIAVILRESVGKFISGVVIGLGYLWVLWDSKKQAWHDKIAHTVVVKV